MSQPQGYTGGYSVGYLPASYLSYADVGPTWTTARLIDEDGDEIFRFDQSNQLILNSLDIGFPDIRTVVDDRAGTDGSLDQTQYFGGRAITAALTLPDYGYYALEDQLRQIMHPGLRYYLMVQRASWASELRIQVRAATYTPSMGWPKTVQLGWVAPLGVFEDEELQVVLTPSLGDGQGGISTPLTFPVAFTPGLIPGAANINVGGTTPTPLVIDIYGPCTTPAITLLSTGDTLAFNINLLAGDYLHVDVGTRQVNLNSIAAQSKYGSIDFARSTWWSLPPGTQQVAFTPRTAGPGTQAQLTWRPKYI